MRQMKQKKKLSYHQLQQEIRRLNDLIAGRERLATSNRVELELKLKQAKFDTDTCMLSERRRLAEALAGLVSGVSDAIRFVIGKEVL